MPILATNDPLIELVSAEPGRVVYRDRQSGERWAELGTCNQCGLCVGDQDRAIVWLKPRGVPGAAHDPHYTTRPHYVTRPDIKRHYPSCSLSFEEA